MTLSRPLQALPDEFPAWLDEEIEVCYLHLHGENDPDEVQQLRGMLDAYVSTARYLEQHGITIRGEHR